MRLRSVVLWLRFKFTRFRSALAGPEPLTYFRCSCGRWSCVNDPEMIHVYMCDMCQAYVVVSQFENINWHTFVCPHCKTSEADEENACEALTHSD